MLLETIAFKLLLFMYLLIWVFLHIFCTEKKEKEREISFRFLNYALPYFTVSTELQSEAVCSKCQVGILAVKTNKNAQTVILRW